MKHAGLLLGGFCALFGRLGLIFRFYFLLPCRRFGFEHLASGGFVGFATGLFDCRQLESLDGRRDVADLVLAAEPWQHQIEIALGHTLDRAGDPHDRFADPAADDKGSHAAENDDEQHDANEQGLLLLERGIVHRDFTIADVLAGLSQIVDKFFDCRKTTRRARHQHQRRAGVAVGHVDDAVRLFCVGRDRRS